MRNDLKAQALSHPRQAIKSQGSPLWFFYLLASIGIVGATLSVFAYLPLRIIGFVLPSARSLAERVARFGIYFLLKIQPWLRLQVDLDIPKNSCLLVSNHRSALDVFVLLAHIKGIRVVAKQILFYIPFLGIMMRFFRAIPIQRGRPESYLKALRTAEVGIRSGDRVHIFPEMTRCVEGYAQVQDFHQAPFWIAFQNRIPVALLVFLDTDLAWPKGSFKLRFGTPVQLKSLGVLDPASYKSVADLQRAAHIKINEAVINNLL